MSILHEDAKVSRLKAIGLFEDASRSALRHLASAADEVAVAPGTILIQQGRDHHEGYVVVTGTVEVIVDDETVAEIGDGEMIGELGLFGQRPASATVRALTAVEVLVIPYNRFDQILDENPALTKTIATKLAARLHGMDVRHRSSHD